MIAFEGYSVPQGFESDGCTWSPDKPLGYDIKPACVMHDYLRRVKVPVGYMTVQQADKIFKRHLKALGLPSWLATIYWVGVKVMRAWFR